MKQKNVPNSDPGNSPTPKSDYYSSSEGWWTVAEVAKYLRIKPVTVRAMAKRGDLPSVLMGRSYRFRRELIDEWMLSKLRHVLEEDKG